MLLLVFELMQIVAVAPVGFYAVWAVSISQPGVQHARRKRFAALHRFRDA